MYLPSRITARLGFAIVAAASSIALVSPGSAQAAASGSLTASPATGTNTSTITLASSGPCSDPNATNIQVTMTGNGFNGSKVVVGNSAKSAYAASPSGGYEVPLTETMQDYANQQNPPATLSGKYSFTLTCRPNSTYSDLGSYVGAIYFTSSSAYQSTPPADPEKLSLKVASNTHVSAGKGQVILKATVTPKQAGSSVTFYRRSGMTGKVVPAGNSAVDGSGVATRVINGYSGAIQLIYSVLQPLPGYQQVRSNDVSYKIA